MRNIIGTGFLLLLLACNAAPSGQKDEKVLQGKEGRPVEAMQAEPQPAPDLPFETYCNARYGYCIDYPDSLLSPQPESYNGDGRIFNDAHGEETLRVWGQGNRDADNDSLSLAQQFGRDLKTGDAQGGREITYQKLETGFYVISGYEKGKIFYQKTIVKENAFASALLRYPKANKAQYDRISESIFRSFR